MAARVPKGVIVEYDFAVAGGAGVLFETTQRHLAALDGIPFDDSVEMRYMQGRDLVQGLGEYFAKIKTKKTAMKAAREIAEAFGNSMSVHFAAQATPSLRNFVRILADNDVKVVIATHAPIAAVREAFDDTLGEDAVLWHCDLAVYGSMSWKGWRDACVAHGLRNFTTAAVTGSGFGAHAAMVAGMPSVAIPNEHVAYQDFGGANAVVKRLDAASAKKVLGVLRIA